MNQGIIGTEAATLVAMVILLAPIHEVEQTETAFTRETLTYQETFVRERQVTGFCFPWICNKTQIQYGIRNTDDLPGEFGINVVFDNGSERG